jgi:hypothetical protein
MVLLIVISIKPPIAGVAQRSRRYCDGHHEMSDLGVPLRRPRRSPGGGVLSSHLAVRRGHAYDMATHAGAIGPMASATSRIKLPPSPINRDHACEHERKSEFCFEVGNET